MPVIIGPWVQVTGLLTSWVATLGWADKITWLDAITWGSGPQSRGLETRDCSSAGLQTWLAGDSRGPCALRKVPPAADAGAADAGDAKPVPGMAAERPPEDIPLAPDAPAAAGGAPEAAPDPEIAAADPDQGSGAVAEAAPDPDMAAPDPQPDAGVGPASLKAEAPPPRGNFIPQDSLPQAEGQGSPADSVGALDPHEQQREDEAAQNISSAAGPAAAGTPAGDSGAPAVGAPSADAPGGAVVESAKEGGGGGALPPLMREHLAEEQQPPLRGSEEPAAGASEGPPAKAAAAAASDAPAPAMQQVAEPGGQNPGAAGSGEPSSGFRGFLARLGWKNMQ